MPKESAGILAYRIAEGQTEILLVHPGGPFFVKKDAGVWSVPKGENDNQEDLWDLARREFTEETGNSISSDNYTLLKPVKTKAGKVVHIFAVNENFEIPFICSNDFPLEWPPHSGKIQYFPEADKAEWFTFDEAKIKIYAYQLPVLEELSQLLNSEH
ncbi:NUDIX domain-containing protein [Pedobacter sp. HMF7647]|uniref:NUDIX domain-containing protein n=1 Tax=Hufsiella arboris TaxID=2695275 RepID=A0A7K1Y7E6_9SPHI|nr:NUDIX domain-containing protein [Hufsiella arboris]MXV50485.1 NUDIX domain-containing protein [Hufsiella arboris]